MEQFGVWRLSPFLQNNDQDRMDLCSIFHKEPGLKNKNSEKGKECRSDGSGWEKGCVFDLIDSAPDKNLSPGNGLFGGRLKDIDTLVCDDMGTEMADFIAAKKGKNRKDGCVIFIHAKAFETPVQYSAAKLAEVCSQTVKNLAFIDRFSNPEEPLGGFEKWKLPWRAGGVIGRVEHRIRKPKIWEESPKLAWDHIKKILQNPLSRLEVWIVMGNGHSKLHLLGLMQTNPPMPEVIQNIYQLEGAWLNVAHMGATLRIFSRP